MKKKILLISIFIIMFFLPQSVLAKPELVVNNPVFTFESVPDGVSVAHEFKIKNTGDTLLHINNVMPP